MEKDTKEALAGIGLLVGLYVGYRWLRGASGTDELGPDPKDVLGAQAELRKLRERFWRVGPNCDIQFKASRDDDEPATLAQLLDDDRDDFKREVIYPAIAYAVGLGYNTTEGVTNQILETMFPECEWPPPGNLAPDCTWDGFSPFPATCTWNVPDFEQMLIWMTFLGLVEESCSQDEAEGGIFVGGSGFACVTDAQTGDKVLRPVQS
jgi:hypothetical protein